MVYYDIEVLLHPESDDWVVVTPRGDVTSEEADELLLDPLPLGVEVAAVRKRMRVDAVSG